MFEDLWCCIERTATENVGVRNTAGWRCQNAPCYST